MVGASNERLDKLVDLCLESGCYGAKLTGAGGGGSVLRGRPCRRDEGGGLAARHEGVQIVHQRGPVRRSESVDNRAVVVKLGGSLISESKTKKFSYRGETIARLAARAISTSGVDVVVVHGGGTLGTRSAKEYGLSSRSSKPSPEGVSETGPRHVRPGQASAIRSWLEGSIHTPSPRSRSLRPREGRSRKWLEQTIAVGFTPVTFGDVVNVGTGWRLVSGDTIALLLSKMLGAERCVFVMDVDGIMGPEGLLRSVEKKDARGAEALPLRGTRQAG